jgi:SPP1 family predicted phage head-tail adaptor
VTTYAAIEPVRGIDKIRAGQDVTQLFVTVTINWQSDILANMRVQALNGTYIIQAIENPYEMNMILKLTCLALGVNE